MEILVSWFRPAAEQGNRQTQLYRHCQVKGGRRQLTDGIPVSTSALSTRNHQPCRLVVYVTTGPGKMSRRCNFLKKIGRGAEI